MDGGGPSGLLRLAFSSDRDRDLGRRQAAGAIAVLFVNSDEDIFTLDYTDQDVGVEKLISLPFACVASNY